ncbi:MAG TPA: Asp-tRNA(Asn)/Glu-tRNA(Gln) amidotransferase subunit GatC [Dehalococcoidia bacterium]|nr:Asp-tRNA(Asn)/Glu-tRNA(Gln) amidotransferase subunit GatC [Dehalococcoidia bacterium]
MPLTPADVRHVAMLARLGLSDDEQARLGAELDKILDHISKLETVDTSAVPETAQVGELVNVMRDDVPAASIGAAAALRNAPVTDGEHFMVGAIQDGELDG